MGLRALAGETFFTLRRRSFLSVRRICGIGTGGGEPGRRTMRLTTLLSALSLAAFALPASAQAPLKIGLLLDMAGPYADIGGQGTVTAARMAVDDFGGNVLGAR